MKEQKSSVLTASAHVALTLGGNETIAPKSSPAKNITISEVQPVSTPTSAVSFAGGKRNASPNVNDPVDKCLKVTDVPGEVQSPIRNGVTRSPVNSQTHLQTLILELRI